jgi:lipopolysaccharide export system protein LptA
MRKALSILLGFLLVAGWPYAAAAQQATTGQAAAPEQPVELNGDVVEYSLDGNVVTASGNVVIDHPQADLYCDVVSFDRLNNIAKATGNVRLVTEQGEITAEELTFDFKTMKGDFHHARIYAEPYYGAARKVSRVSASKIVMEDGYVTTSDFDKPEYRVASSKIEIYPRDKIIAKHNRIQAGPVPLVYLPYFRQRLDQPESGFQFTPGYEKDWGIFLLTTYRQYVNENLRANFHVDYRELLDLGWGIDVDYNSLVAGKGILKTYYTKERAINADRIWQERTSPTPERERYKIEWRHRWQMDDKTNAIMQYYKLSDADFLKDYFEREFDEDQSPPTFFVMTRTLPFGAMSLRTDQRINRFVDATERLPEVRYDLRHQRIGNTGFYYSNFSTATSLSKVNASPSDVRIDTNRIHFENQISHPFKLAFLEISPFVGRESTFYSRAKDREQDSKFRDYFKAGASMQTKFYRVYDTDIDFLGEEIKRMRHIVTPSFTYFKSTEPTIEDFQLEQFDEIDTRQRQDVVNVALENKLQVKRNEKTVDFLRAIISSDYHLKSSEANDGFNVLEADIDFRPTDWLRFFYDSEFDLERDKFDTSNFDLYINSGDKWRFGLGRRFNTDVDDQLTTYFQYVFNPKWKFKMLQRFNIDDAQLEEHQYVLTRDLHSWEVDFHINDDLEGSEFIMIFRLKAFPEIGFDFGSSFNERESGSEPATATEGNF